MNGHDEARLFIGCLPGEEKCQVVLFPHGRVLAEICEEQRELELPDGGVTHVSDRGLRAAHELIETLNNNDWHIEEVSTVSAFWLKPTPHPLLQEPFGISIKAAGPSSISERQERNEA